ncbi:hypothetical protein MASR2M17_16630 [Aminivibrio sp.]
MNRGVVIPYLCTLRLAEKQREKGRAESPDRNFPESLKHPARKKAPDEVRIEIDKTRQSADCVAGQKEAFEAVPVGKMACGELEQDERKGKGGGEIADVFHRPGKLHQSARKKGDDQPHSGHLNECRAAER